MAVPELSSSESDCAPQPGGKASGVTRPENFQQGPLPKGLMDESEQNAPNIRQSPTSDAKEDNRALLGEPLIPRGSGNTEEQNEKEGEPEDGGRHPEYVDNCSTYLDMKGIDWTEDLSSDAQWLFKELLIGAEDILLLEEYAAADGIDLDAAVKELDQYDLVDRTDLGFFHLPWKKIPPNQEIVDNILLIPP